MYKSAETYVRAVEEISVYLVEDKKSYRDAIQELINGVGDMYCPFTFSSCEEYIAVMHDIPTPQVILMDIRIPGKMSGIEGVRLIHEKTPDIYIVMLTLSDTDDDIFASICAGACGYLIKLVEPEDIVSGVREAANGGLAMSRHAAGRVLNIFRKFLPTKKDYDLSPREIDVLQLLVDGLTKKEIADELCIAYTTVDSHVQKIYRKLHVHSATQAVRKAIDERLV